MRAIPDLEAAEKWVGSTVIEAIELIRVRIPLIKPYHLSFGSLDYFDTVYCGIFLDGRYRWGETTPLPGYGTETAENAWHWSMVAAKSMVGTPAHQAFLRLHEQSASRPFSAAGLMAALETQALQTELLLPGQAPIIAPLHGETPAEVSNSAANLVECGFTTVKLKIGRNPALDQMLVKAALKSLPRNVNLRVDANQGCDLPGALGLWEIMGDSVEYLEQPFPPHHWNDLEAMLTRYPDCRLCLDESIWLPGDLKQAIDLPEKVTIKLKLMKQSSAWQTMNMARMVTEAGLSLVLGNGVQSELGSLQEWAVYSALGLQNAAEFNGFAKQLVPLWSNMDIDINHGCFKYHPSPAPPNPGKNVEPLTTAQWKITI